jgi:hypothetical protein
MLVDNTRTNKATWTTKAGPSDAREVVKRLEILITNSSSVDVLAPMTLSRSFEQHQCLCKIWKLHGFVPTISRYAFRKLEQVRRIVDPRSR